MPLTFNDALNAAGIEPRRAHLARHIDHRLKPFELFHCWKSDREKFEAYQAVQKRPIFAVGNVLASFIVTPHGQTMFAALYRIESVSSLPEGAKDPLLGCDTAGMHLYDLQRDARLSEYSERLTIEWGKAYVVWAQRAGRVRPKLILSLSPSPLSTKF